MLFISYTSIFPVPLNYLSPLTSRTAINYLSHEGRGPCAQSDFRRVWFFISLINLFWKQNSRGRMRTVWKLRLGRSAVSHHWHCCFPPTWRTSTCFISCNWSVVPNRRDVPIKNDSYAIVSDGWKFTKGCFCPCNWRAQPQSANERGKTGSLSDSWKQHF